MTIWKHDSYSGTHAIVSSVRYTTIPPDLEAELSALIENANFAIHPSSIHDGQWSGIALLSSDGHSGTMTAAGPGGEYLETEISGYVPQTLEYLRAFPGTLGRVRYLRLLPGAVVDWHIDPLVDFVRLHIPLQTNEDSKLFILNQAYQWPKNGIWTADFSFPHKVVNFGTSDRIHLVFDLYLEERPRHFFSEESFLTSCLDRNQAIQQHTDRLRLLRS